MNAGGEYVLYRIWATFQDRNGIHAESLLTCVGALAGYACQMYARRGNSHVNADTALIDSSLSVWSLVGRTLQKLGQPLPDIQEIVGYVSRTEGSAAFGVPRAPDGHRPRHAANVYLKQIWPQILPIAQRFCRKPMQLPVLFGIALQRAIEHTKDRLSPTLAASIAMESAVAMARAVLPDDVVAPASPAVEVAVAAAPGTRLPAIAPETPAPPARKSRRRKAATIRDEGSSAPSIGVLVARIPPAARLVTMASVAFMTFAGVMYDGGAREAPEGTREVRRLVNAASPSEDRSPLFAAATASDTSGTEDFEGPPLPTEPPAAEAAASEPSPSMTFEETPDDPAVAYNPPPQTDNGMDEGVMRDDFGEPLKD